MKEPEGPLYRDWEFAAPTERDWFFKELADPPVSRRDLEKIRPLSDEYSRLLWGVVYAGKRSEGHVVRGKSKIVGNQVVEDWTEATLRRACCWPDTEAVYIVMSNGHFPDPWGYEILWEIFLRYWKGIVGFPTVGLLLHPVHRETLAFEDGYAHLVRRNKRRITKPCTRPGS